MDEIIEYHCCNDCKERLLVPRNWDYSDLEVCCKLNQKECNHSGGLTRCKVFKSKEE